MEVQIKIEKKIFNCWGIIDEEYIDLYFAYSGPFNSINEAYNDAVNELADWNINFDDFKLNNTLDNEGHSILTMTPIELDCVLVDGHYHVLVKSF